MAKLQLLLNLNEWSAMKMNMNLATGLLFRVKKSVKFATTELVSIAIVLIGAGNYQKARHHQII